MNTVYISIGNSDDKLSQSEWADYIMAVTSVLSTHHVTIHGLWFSETASPWQNCCWCVECEDETGVIRGELGAVAERFRQDSIAWAVAETEFLVGESCHE